MSRSRWPLAEILAETKKRTYSPRGRRGVLVMATLRVKLACGHELEKEARVIAGGFELPRLFVCSACAVERSIGDHTGAGER